VASGSKMPPTSSPHAGAGSFAASTGEALEGGSVTSETPGWAGDGAVPIPAKGRPLRGPPTDDQLPRRCGSFRRGARVHQRALTNTFEAASSFIRGAVPLDRTSRSRDVHRTPKAPSTAYQRATSSPRFCPNGMQPFQARAHQRALTNTFDVASSFFRGAVPLGRTSISRVVHRTPKSPPSRT
jgi:hypothetical protein